jgi:hypothetical protein
MKERRRAPRIHAKLAMEVKLGTGGTASASSINVSANGIYFCSDNYIEPLTRLEITLLLPRSDPHGPEAHEVACQGVVVRIDPDKPVRDHTKYDIACYFTEIAERDRDTLESYILQQLSF